jgi:hypothetical protein
MSDDSVPAVCGCDIYTGCNHASDAMPKVTLAMEEAGREWARSHDPSTFADIFEAMWKAKSGERDCEVCGGDCAAATPPVYNCPMRPSDPTPPDIDDIARIIDPDAFGAHGSTIGARARRDDARAKADRILALRGDE